MTDETAAAAPYERARTEVAEFAEFAEECATAFSRLVTVAEAGSTNADLVAARGAAPQDWPHLSALRAVHQTAGHGRAGRTWVTGADDALTVSIVVAPAEVSGATPAWPSLTPVVALAVVRVLRGWGLAAAIKWPNDVVLDGVEPPLPGWGPTRKIAGILAEVVPSAAGVAPAAVVGIGVNLGQRALPVPWATSLALAGVALSPAEVLDGIGRALLELLPRWTAGEAALADEVAAASATLGRRVRVETGTGADRADGGGGGALEGVAEALDGEGRLVLRTAAGERVTVAAGDVHHLRRAEPDAVGRTRAGEDADAVGRTRAGEDADAVGTRTAAAPEEPASDERRPDEA
ncbi:biotin--[acetyl-CoA-carboxylase] ligase [Miniimonas sp. S16]|uniref:biotin--[acetyl-CoA-carboxylase] ligase n=1 Tax=Miniimonas sp. S16 TaxID=2171623 RepID=UPI000D527DE6|nr:biotin--[acetyl-CoA-carboxylase] ligase [Miniimonas sp. S16]